MEEAFKRTCPICGKIFYSYDSEAWAYKVTINSHQRRVCSWKCRRKWEKKSKANDKRRKEKNTDEL